MNTTILAEYESVSEALAGIANHAGAIARGLENAAPPSVGSATGSVHYLHAVASLLQMESKSLLPEQSAGTPASWRSLLQALEQVIREDAALREKFQVGDRFRFVQDRLQALVPPVEVQAQMEADRVSAGQLLGGAQLEGQPVYVYLYNAEGMVFRTWAALLTPRAFYEYSVSRPVYRDKKAVEDVIAQKPNRQKHAYLTVAVSPDAISGDGAIIRVREGSLSLDRLMLFTHNGHDYVLGGGELRKS